MPTKAGTTTDEVLFFCDRCATALQPGTADSYRVTIEAVADPWPPVVSGDDSPADLRRKIERLLEQMEGLSAQEAMDQVYRRVTLYLCVRCYRPWIENPLGTSDRIARSD
jgi:hypothetical protein